MMKNDEIPCAFNECRSSHQNFHYRFRKYASRTLVCRSSFGWRDTLLTTHTIIILVVVVVVFAVFHCYCHRHCRPILVSQSYTRGRKMFEPIQKQIFTILTMSLLFESHP